MKRPSPAESATRNNRRHFILSVLGAALIPALIACFFAIKLHSARSTEATADKPGPWGNLDFVRINIELPDQFIDVTNIDRNGWTFPSKSPDQALQQLQQCGLSNPQLDAVRQAKWLSNDTGCHVTPSDDIIFALTPETRSKLYAMLAASEDNVDQYYAFTYQPDQLPELLKYTDLREETIHLFKSLLYPQGSLLRFADTDVVLRKLTDMKERLRFVKTVARRSTLLVKLNVTPDSDISELVNYWGAGGRSKDLRPLLESLARVPGGCRIDIAHLLPPFARKRIYTYPNPEDEGSDVRQDCHWSSLNFFNNSKNRSFSSPEQVAQTISAEYTLVGTDLSNAHFGDVIFLKTSDDILIHSAVYIAGDIVFTKSGAGLNQPWIYMKVADVLAYYALPNDTLRMAVYRSKRI